MKNFFININNRGLLELQCYLIAYDTKILVGANGRSPRRQRFRNFINSAYYPNSNRPFPYATAKILKCYNVKILKFECLSI